VLPFMPWCFEVRGGRLGDEVTSQTQAIQSIADIFALKSLKSHNMAKFLERLQVVKIVRSY
jgi:hypothetical protein